MARLPRLVVAGLPHVVVHRGLNGQPVLLDEADRAAYLQALAGATREAGVLLHGYGLFAGEVRLLATPTSATALGQMMQAVGRRYVRAFNQRHQRAGTPWEGRFRSTVLEPQAHFIDALRFVEGCDDDGTALASGAETLRWSSAGHHLGRRHEPGLTEHEVFWALGNTPFERQAVYRARFEAGLSSDDIDAITRATRHGWALGSPAFVTALTEATARRAAPLRPGRPRKREPGTI